MWWRLSSWAVFRVIRSAFLGASVALLLTGAAPDLAKAEMRPRPRPAESFRVIDGDGIELGGQSVRLWGIDAPELRQECSKDGRRYPCGEEAKEALTAFLGAAAPICETVNRDRYGREVAKCEVAGDDLAALMVRSGWAVDWPRYSKGAYANNQDEAETHKRGLWAGFFAAPWEWRAQR